MRYWCCGKVVVDVRNCGRKNAYMRGCSTKLNLFVNNAQSSEGTTASNSTSSKFQMEARVTTTTCKPYHIYSPLPSRAPAPDIQSNLCTRQDWQPRMIGLLISPTVRSNIFPIHSIPFDGFESDSHLLPPTATSILIGSTTLQKFTPPPPSHLGHLQPRELRPATLAIRINIHHEDTHTISFSAATAPVMVMLVMTAFPVSLRSQSFNVEIRPPALEGASPVLDAAHSVIPIEQRYF